MYLYLYTCLENHGGRGFLSSPAHNYLHRYPRLQSHACVKSQRFCRSNLRIRRQTGISCHSLDMPRDISKVLYVTTTSQLLPRRQGRLLTHLWDASRLL